MRWSVEYLDSKVEEQIESLSREMRKDFERIVELIKEFGLEEIHAPLIKHLEGPLWEMRIKDRDGIARAAYITASRRRVVVVHVFTKKTQKTPRREIEYALKRAKEVNP
ncbi:MAG: type II toxin-antitoxin system RelE/ParE family toxin [Thermomicrobiales bacterium]